MNKVKTTTEGLYRVVWVNDIPSKKFHIKSNDNAYNDAKDYAHKMLSAKEFTPLFPITKERIDQLKAYYTTIEYDCNRMLIKCKEEPGLNVWDIFSEDGMYIQSYRIKDN